MICDNMNMHSAFNISSIFKCILSLQYLMGFTVLNIIYNEYGACLPVLGARSAHLSVEDLGERGHGLYHDIFRAKLPLTIFKRMVVTIYMQIGQPTRFAAQVIICRSLEREESFHIFGWDLIKTVTCVDSETDEGHRYESS